jgi:opacity protein-like surface antigen
VSLGVFLLAGAMLPAKADAQYVFLGGGATIAMGDFKDYAKTGWLATGGVGYDVTSKVWVEAEAYYGQNSHSDVAGDKTKLLGFIGAVGYSFSPDKKVSPYVTAGAGMLQHKYVPATGDSESDSKFAYTGAAGIGFNLNETVHLWIEGRFLGRKDTQLIPIMAGFTFSFGKSSM